MRRLCPYFFILALAGCGSLEGKVAGTWHVDPATVSVSRLAKGAGQSRDWADATAMLGTVQVTFDPSGSVKATGFDLTSSAKWSLRGRDIIVSGTAETWPKMVVVSSGDRIHVTESKRDDVLEMDLER